VRVWGEKEAGRWRRLTVTNLLSFGLAGNHASGNANCLLKPLLDLPLQSGMLAVTPTVQWKAPMPFYKVSDKLKEK